MQLFKRTLKLFGCMAAALVGVAAAVLIFMSFMVVEVEDSFMLPELEPGSSVIAVRTPLPVGYRFEAVGKGGGFGGVQSALLRN